MKSCNEFNETIQNADILRKKIVGNELYWEFSFEESKPSHVKGVESFINLVPQYYFPPKYSYINLDPVFFQIVDVQGLLDVVPKEIDKVYNYKNEMLYVLKGKNISGVDLKMYSFFKFDIKEIQEEISVRSAVFINDMDGQMHLNQYKILPNFTLLKRYLITLL